MRHRLPINGSLEALPSKVGTQEVVITVWVFMSHSVNISDFQFKVQGKVSAVLPFPF